MKTLEAIDPREIFLSPAQTINEASRILIDNSLKAAPVLDDNKNCLGIISLIFCWKLSLKTIQPINRCRR